MLLFMMGRGPVLIHRPERRGVPLNNTPMEPYEAQSGVYSSLSGPIWKRHGHPISCIYEQAECI